MFEMNIPKKYWRYGVRFANFIKNRTVFRKGERKSPYERLHKKEWDISRFRVPFCKVRYQVETDDKLDPRAHEGTFVTLRARAST